jgi:hypothetical protein
MCNCGQGRAPVVGVNGQGQAGAKADPGKGELVRIEYHGALGAPAAVIGPVTRQDYGRRMKGDVFFVYAADQQARSDLFVGLPAIQLETAQTAVPPPPTPLGLTSVTEA